MNKSEETKIINEFQQQNYERFEKRTSLFLLEEYACILEKVKDRKTLKILDIGGASGYFAMAVREYFPGKMCEIVVVDTTKYDTWTSFSDKITFIEGSADNLTGLFEANTFDLVFANRVFHHFVKQSWNKSINGMFNILRQIALIMKHDGYLCIIDYFYNGLLCDKAASKIIFSQTTTAFPPIVFLNRKLGAKSAGVGVCFLSKKMWFTLFAKTGFVIDILKEKPAFKMNKLKQDE